MQLFNKILIANRGEIAVRIMRTAKEMGIPTVAVFAEADRDSLHTKMADEIYCIGESALDETYLNMDKIISVAKDAQCDAIHPGYGFLAENEVFAKKCTDAGIQFIGPAPDSIRIMGNKVEARNLMKEIGVPLIEGSSGDYKELEARAIEIGFPVLIKAAGGGGGKGMRIVNRKEDLSDALKATSREAQAYFGDDRVFIEKYITKPRHIELQILGDQSGNVIHLFERECSVQRRYQKIIEEAPSPTLTSDVREKMAATALLIAKHINYVSAGTIEFLVDENLDYYFLEMNTRIQVEHPVTEAITGVDIVREQIRIAAGHKLSFTLDQIQIQGHAIEARVYAEDPAKDFMPSPGLMSLYSEPDFNGTRLDTGITAESEIKSFYDPMICKLISHGNTRDDSIRKILLALNDYKIHGIRTNIQYLKKLINHDAFRDNLISTNFCDTYTDTLIEEIVKEKCDIPFANAIAAFLLKEIAPSTSQNVWKNIGYWRSVMQIPLHVDDDELVVRIKHLHGNHIIFELEEKDYYAEIHRLSDHKIEFTLDKSYLKVYFSDQSDGKCDVEVDTHIWKIQRRDKLNDKLSYDFEDNYQGGQYDAVFSPMHGKVTQLKVDSGDEVKLGDTLLIIEAMKMENNILAPKDGIIDLVHVELNNQIESGKLLLTYKTPENTRD
jgi:3-methylcrotonyl-CoA carboxylase alpha subunit